MKKLLLSVAGICLVFSGASAQLTTGAWGISPGLTFYPGGTTRPLELGYAVQDNLRLYGDLALSTYSNSESTTDLDFTVGADYYVWHMESIATFIGGNLGIGSISGTGGSTSFLLNPEFGADYFLSPHFSINGTLGFGLSAGTTTIFTTQTGIHATWWLK